MAKDLSGQQVGMSPANDVNNPRPNIPRGYNQFPQSYMHLTTEQYGMYSPFYWAKCERGDIQNLHSEHELHSFTMQSPFVGNLKKTKSYIKVPLQAIYPNCWNLMLPIPTQGDDVPADTRALFNVRVFLEVLVEVLATSSFSNLTFKQVALLEAVASHGSLFEKFNIHFDFKFSMDADNAVSRSIDYWLDTLIYPTIIEFAKDHSFFVPAFYDDTTILVKDAEDEDDRLPENRYISPSRFLELLRSGEINTTDAWEDFDMRLFENLRLDSGYNSISDDGSTDNLINIEPIIAYQLACAQFATNDFVDFVYSADLYRKNMLSLISSTFGLDHFEYNGLNIFYDFASSHYLDIMYSDFNVSECLDYWLNLFSFVPSLRYGDYFTGGKPQPLAVGEYTAAVNNNEVSAIDITRSIQMQRLLHRVNMVGRKLGDYLSGIFGGRLPEAEKDIPVFLAHQLFDVEGFETNNTGDAQLNPDVNNIITTNLRSTKDKFAFEVTIDEPCYIIGMSSYAMQRVYSKSVDRFAFHHDRYDDFIPEMQYIGDQSIYAKELDANFTDTLAADYPFAYTLRFMEYKQRYSYASGGFVENLPSWSFITDNRDGNPVSQKISPEYIRSSPSEFDRFFKSLTGYSLGSRFHFIVAYKNITSPLRRMEYTPEILK